MRCSDRLTRALVVGALSVMVGCQGSTTAPPANVETPAPPAAAAADPEVRASLDKLPADDRKVAEAQKTCPISGEPLGSMGVPPKLTLDGQAVFVCCEGCSKRAEADPPKTLKKVAALKAGM